MELLAVDHGRQLPHGRCKERSVVHPPIADPRKLWSHVAEIVFVERCCCLVRHPYRAGKYHGPDIRDLAWASLNIVGGNFEHRSLRLALSQRKCDLLVPSAIRGRGELFSL